MRVQVSPAAIISTTDVRYVNNRTVDIFKGTFWLMDDLIFQKITSKVISQLDTLNANLLKLANVLEKLVEKLNDEEDEGNAHRWDNIDIHVLLVVRDVKMAYFR